MSYGPWLKMAADAAQDFSDDPDCQVGAIIVTRDNELLAQGINQFPPGVKITLERITRPEKYKWIEHAERNAIYSAAKQGLKLDGCSIYITRYPCADCARAIIQSGIKYIFTNSPNWDHPRWGEDYKVSKQMFEEAKIHIYLRVNYQ